MRAHARLSALDPCAPDPVPGTWAIVLDGGWPRALDCALRLVPPERLIVVTTRGRSRDGERALAAAPGARHVVQPAYRGGAVEAFLSLLKVARDDPHAVVVILPGAIHVDQESSFVRGLARAARAARLRPDLPILIGASPRTPVADGWIEPGAPVEGLEMLAVRTVERFVDCAPPAERRRLFDAHALTSTLVLVGRVDRLLALGRRQLPDVLEALEPLEAAMDTPEEELLSDAVYEAMPEASLAPVERAPGLAVLALPDVAWYGPPPEPAGAL